MKPNPFQALPESVEVGGAERPINSDFRVGVAIETEVLGGSPDVAGLLLSFYKGVIPEPVEEAVEKMVWFYSCAPDVGAGKESKEARSYDFAVDADVLLASFLTAYGIDLTTASLHWWAFRRLMLNLPHDTPFMQRVHYRVADTKKMTGDQRKHYKKMQKLYALKKHTGQSMTVEERDAALLEKMRKRYEEAQKDVESRQS